MVVNRQGINFITRDLCFRELQNRDKRIPSPTFTKDTSQGAREMVQSRCSKDKTRNPKEGQRPNSSRLTQCSQISRPTPTGENNQVREIRICVSSLPSIDQTRWAYGYFLKFLHVIIFAFFRKKFVQPSHVTCIALQIMFINAKRFSEQSHQFEILNFVNKINFNNKVVSQPEYQLHLKISYITADRWEFTCNCTYSNIWNPQYFSHNSVSLANDASFKSKARHKITTCFGIIKPDRHYLNEAGFRTDILRPKQVFGPSFKSK